jgi:hypothetical protein
MESASPVLITVLFAIAPLTVKHVLLLRSYTKNNVSIFAQTELLMSSVSVHNVPTLNVKNAVLLT